MTTIDIYFYRYNTDICLYQICIEENIPSLLYILRRIMRRHCRNGQRSISVIEDDYELLDPLLFNTRWFFEIKFNVYLAGKELRLFLSALKDDLKDISSSNIPLINEVEKYNDITLGLVIRRKI